VRRAPLLAPAVALLLAILAEQHGAASIALIAAMAALAFASVAQPVGPELRTAAAAIGVALLCGSLASVAWGHPPIVAAERATARYAALVVGDVRDGDDGASSTLLAIDGIGTVRATLHGSIAPGQRISVRGRIEPFDEPRNPGEPSMRDIMMDEGIAGRLATARVLDRLPVDAWDSRAWATRMRAVLSQRLRASVPEPPATILAGALWGERGALPDDVRAAFQATGTVHVLVTAGLHLGIIAALTMLLLNACRMHRASACATTLAVVIAYAWFSGAHLPSERAATMIGVALVARACGARIASWNALAVAAIAVALLWPASVGSASFALSFSCVAAIVLLAEPLTHLFERVPIPERLREALALTLATQIGTWPLTAAIFSTVAPFAVIANAIVVPLVALILPLGIATLLVPPLAPLATLLLLIVQHTVSLIAALPGAHATIATPPFFTIVAYDCAILAIAKLIRRERIATAAVIFIMACSIVAAPSFIHPRHGLIITHLDVGQADAAVIRTPNDHIILIDTGGELEHGGATSNAERAGARIVLAYLQRMGVRSIDLMLLTHPHGDHVGGAAPIIEAMPVGMIFDWGQAYSGRAYRDAMVAARLHGVPVVLARRGMHWTSGDGVTLDILAPSMPFLAETGDDVNENSIVVMLHAGAFRELFMGDAGEASESGLLAADVACHRERSRGTVENITDGVSSTSRATTCDDLHADVVKVGHHGSRYASTLPFVSVVHPQIAVISVGRHNTFGHPAPATITAWNQSGATVLRTDKCGAISIANLLSATMLSCAPAEATTDPKRGAIDDHQPTDRCTPSLRVISKSPRPLPTHRHLIHRLSVARRPLGRGEIMTLRAPAICNSGPLGE
jgi:competence protein ComEC